MVLCRITMHLEEQTQLGQKTVERIMSHNSKETVDNKNKSIKKQWHYYYGVVALWSDCICTTKN